VIKAAEKGLELFAKMRRDLWRKSSSGSLL